MKINIEELERRAWKVASGMDEYTLIISDDGITYKGFNFGQAGGGFFGGHQTVIEFEENGGINEMPADLERDLRAYYRRRKEEIGAQPIYIDLKNMEPQDLSLDFYLQKNESPIEIKYDLKLEPGSLMAIYKGIILQDPIPFDILITIHGDNKMQKLKLEFIFDPNNGKERYVLEIKAGSVIMGE